jgi:hypothetical protein
MKLPVDNGCWAASAQNQQMGAKTVKEKNL